MQKKYLVPVIGIGIILILSVIYLGSPKAPQQGEQPLQVSSSIAPGKQTYTILTDKPKNPQITQVELDPLDVKLGNTQTITVYVQDTGSNPITKRTGVAGVIHTDNGETKVDFALKQADGLPAEASAKEGPPSLTQWQGTWTLQDSTNTQYMATISAYADFGKSQVDISFR